MNQNRLTGLRLFTGNRLEILAEQLSLILKEPIADIFSNEIIIVQSRGMERYVSMELARNNQISANCSFPFPNVFLNDIFKKIIQDLPENSPFENDPMIFKIMKILPGILDRSEFESLEFYLKKEQNPLKLFQLAEKISNLFDHYVIYRPEMIFQWEKNQEEDLGKNNWQPILWRKIVGRHVPLHQAYLRNLFFKMIRNQNNLMARLPDRVSIFGISYLPPFHLETFLELSRALQVNMFILNPCMEYWFDIYSDHEIRKIRKKYFKSELPKDDFHLEQGNPLLASLGGQGRNFFSFLYEHDCEFIELFEEIQPKKLLSRVQSDILHLRHRELSHRNEGKNRTKEPSDSDAKNSLINNHDHSIQVHSCHSPLREIEVLHDNLLKLFDQDHTILPKDIIVLTTDIEKYAPFIHIVFDTQLDPSLRIPYAIADQSIRKESRIIEGFLTLLSLKDSRWTVSQIMSILEFPDVRTKFHFTELDLEKLEYWIQDINIRWGIDADHRQELGLPGFSQNTWKAGLERLLLGYAMPGYDKNLFQGVLPYDHIEGNDALILGRLIKFSKAIFECKNLFNRQLGLGRWSRELILLLDRFFLASENTEHDFQLVREVLNNLVQIESTTQYHDHLDISVVHKYLEKRLQNKSFGYGFLSGGVTFCAMLPMRSIPFKVVYLIGMNSGVFPRDSQPLDFDLISRNPRKGDRSRRNDDKYLFLESILSARNRLYISHVGQDIQDNSQIPPSTLVSELIDYIKVEYQLSDKDLITQHRLQPFHPDYFTENSKLFSYSKENLRAARYLPQEPHWDPFIGSSLPEPSDDFKNLTVQDISDFFKNPVQFLFRKRLGVYLENKITEFDDSENYLLKGLEKYWFEQDILVNHLTHDIQENEINIQKAKGTLPHGSVGEYSYRRSKIGVDRFANRMKSFHKNEDPRSLELILNIKDFNITGNISNVYSNGLILFRFGRLKPKDLIFAWIHHLFLCVIKETGYQKKTTLLCKDSVWEFKTVEKSQNILETLLSNFRQGLIRPLPLFSESSFEYARQVIFKHKSEAEALGAAKNKWKGNDFINGERDNPYFELCFKHMDPLNDQFKAIAIEFFSPLISHAREITV